MNKSKKKKSRQIWVFGDYRNYFQNRVTLQLLSKAAELAQKIGGEVCAVVFGNDIEEYIWEYTCHGAEKVYALEHDRLSDYPIETYVNLMEIFVRQYQPEILLVGATSFGREFTPRLAKRLKTGLSADCIGLDINDEELLVQTAPSFGGNLLAKIVTPKARPQMATVRPGIFQEIPHDNDRTSTVIQLKMPENLPRERVKMISSSKSPSRTQKIEEANVVVCGGRGMGSKTKFKKIFELARLLTGEVGATRPVVYSSWAGHETLVGQAGKNINPKVLFSFGISGAIQHTAAITNADFIIAVNKNPNAMMMKLADVAVVADANQICTALIKELRNRIRA